MDITALVEAVALARADDAFAPALERWQWAQLAAEMQRRELRAGELLLRSGDVDAAAYLVESGRLQVFVTGGPAASHRVATLEAGTVVGEPAWFAPVARMAHVEAATPCVVWSLPTERLHSLARHEPALVLEVLRAAGAVMAARMRANLERGIPAA